MPKIVGIDDFAWRRNHRYDTLVCDLERHCIIALLPVRERGTAYGWLATRPFIDIAERDRGGYGERDRGGYGEAIARGLPQAVQVADRWHLMENASRSFLNAVRFSMRRVREVVGAAGIDPALLTAAERIQYKGYLRREETDVAIRALSGAGVSIRQLVRRLGHSRRVVRYVLRGERGDVFRFRQSSLEAYLPWLDTQWEAGDHNATALWRRALECGFKGSLRVVGEWATRRRRTEKAEVERLQHVPSARTLARLLTTSRDHLSKAEMLTVAAVEQGVSPLAEARKIIAAFQAMVRTIAPDKLDAWIERASDSLVAAFARDIARDEAAVRAALTLPWSNGQAEGQITKLKLVKPRMYERGRINPLQARLVGTAPP